LVGEGGVKILSEFGLQLVGIAFRLFSVDWSIVGRTFNVVAIGILGLRIPDQCRGSSDQRLVHLRHRVIPLKNLPAGGICLASC
jgi:hypothetical protein